MTNAPAVVALALQVRRMRLDQISAWAAGNPQQVLALADLILEQNPPPKPKGRS